MSEHPAGIRIIGPDDGETLRRPQGHDRFIVPGDVSGGGLALLEHFLFPRALAGPVHRHSREDEYSYVLEGRLGAILGGDEVMVEAGSLLSKPRGQWHTFWNASDDPVRVLEIISPGGFEQAFRELSALEEPTPEAISELAARYGVDVDFDATMSVVERHGVTF
ncbi:MAG: cupin domain-containing protein [Chloroflexota bacterium]|nr:cupin domain-containing protein [Chloroflexota bacterium]